MKKKHQPEKKIKVSRNRKSAKNENIYLIKRKFASQKKQKYTLSHFVLKSVKFLSQFSTVF